jgi:hypothetical protein
MTGGDCVTLLNDANMRVLVRGDEGVMMLKLNIAMSNLEDTSSLKSTTRPS